MKKTKVLFIAPYRQTDGWGEKAKALIVLLSSLCDLTVRPVWFNNEFSATTGTERLDELESKNEEEFDVLIQFSLPNQFVYDGRFKKTVAITSFGCTHKNIDVSAILNMFDKVAVFSDLEVQYAFESGIPSDKLVNFGSAPYSYENVKPFNYDFGHDRFQGVTFYTTASLAIDSGFRETLIAYLTISKSYKNTTLAILTNNPEEVKKEIEKTRNALGVSSQADYPKIAICNPTDPNDRNHYIEQAHHSFDVFVNVGYNAHDCQDTLSAYRANNKVIAFDNGNFPKNGYAYVARSQEDICFHPEKPLPHMFTSNTTWIKPVIKSVRDEMEKILREEFGIEVDLIEDRFTAKTEQFNNVLEELICTQ